MRHIIYLNLFILCYIFSEGSSFLEENNEKSANLHGRKKRIIDRSPGGDRPVQLERVPYIVSIIKNNRHRCGGSILSPNIVITAAHCILAQAEYQVLSGSTYANQGTHHIITGVHFFPGYTPVRPTTHNFVLLTIYPFINFEHSPNRPISLLNGELLLDTIGTVSGWGSNEEPPNLGLPGSIRSITLPIVGRIMCQQYYNHGFVIIDDKKFCVFDLCDQKACGVGDTGNPFVVNGHLAGIQILSRKSGRAPEVFVNLCVREYKEWIHAQIARLPPNEHAIHVPLIMDGNH